MKIADLDFKNGNMYIDQYDNVWIVQNEELVDESLINIHYSYTMKEIIDLELEKY